MKAFHIFWSLSFGDIETTIVNIANHYARMRFYATFTSTSFATDSTEDILD